MSKQAAMTHMQHCSNIQTVRGPTAACRLYRNCPAKAIQTYATTLEQHLAQHACAITPDSAALSSTGSCQCYSCIQLHSVGRLTPRQGLEEAPAGHLAELATDKANEGSSGGRVQGMDVVVAVLGLCQGLKLGDQVGRDDETVAV